MKNLRENENVVVLGVFLGITALISALVLALVSQLTAKPIAEMKKKTMQLSLKQLALPDFDNAPDKEAKKFETPAGWKAEIMPFRQKGKVTGFAVKTASPDGYGGPVEIMAGFTPKGVITAVLVTSHKETPGLGSKVCERKFRKTIFNFFEPAPAGLPPNPRLDQFKGKTVPAAASWKVKRDGGDFDFVTGATITSRAVLNAVSEAGRTLAAHKAEFLKGGK